MGTSASSHGSNSDEDKAHNIHHDPGHRTHIPVEERAEPGIPLFFLNTKCPFDQLLSDLINFQQRMLLKMFLKKIFEGNNLFLL